MVETIHSPLNSIEQFSILCFIGALLLLPIVLINFRQELKLAKINLYPVRSLISIAGMLTWMEAVKNLGSNESILVNYSTPIFAVLLAGLIKEEKLQRICLCAGLICLGIIGMTLKLKIAIAPYGFMMALFSALLWAAYEVICKKQTHHEHFLVQVFYTFAFAALFLLPFSLKLITTLPSNDWIMLSGMALLRIANVVGLFLAIKWATLNWLMPVSYMKFPIMAAVGFLFLGKANNSLYWISALCLVLVNIAVMLLRKHKLQGLSNKKPLPAI